MEQIDEISIEIEDQDQLKTVRAQKLEKEGSSSFFNSHTGGIQELSRPNTQFSVFQIEFKLWKPSQQKKISKIQSLFQKRADWFDIFEFLHEVGASQKLLSHLAEDDLTAVTQCQVF